MPEQSKLPKYRDAVEADELAAEWIANPKRSGPGLMSEGAVQALVRLALDPAPLRDASFMTPGGAERWRNHKEEQAAKVVAINALPEPERTKRIAEHHPNCGYSEHYGMALARMIADHPDEAPMLWTWAREEGRRRIGTAKGKARFVARRLHLVADWNGEPTPKAEEIADRVRERFGTTISTAAAEDAVKAERHSGGGSAAV
jgi:hypothetical protein